MGRLSRPNEVTYNAAMSACRRTWSMAVELMEEMVPGQGLNMYILQLAVEVGTHFRDEDQQKKAHFL